MPSELVMLLRQQSKLGPINVPRAAMREAADHIEALEAWKADIERKICAAEHGHNINDVLANYRTIRRKIQDDRANRLVEKETDAMVERPDTPLDEMAERIATVLNDFAGRLPIKPEQVDLRMLSEICWALNVSPMIEIELIEDRVKAVTAGGGND